MKSCSTCHKMKSLDSFSVRSDTNSVRGVCKDCRRLQQQSHYRPHKQRLRYKKRKQYCIDSALRNRDKYINQWKQWFRQLYTNPICQICGTQLNFDGGSTAVRFDHRNDRSYHINKNPSDWFRERPCNIKNQQLFLQSDFGILCVSCNAALPTQNRKEWIDSVIRYMSSNLKEI